MSLEIRPYTSADREALRAVLTHPSVAPQFDKFQGADGLEHKLDDRKLAQDGMRLAFVDGELAGFGVMWLLQQHDSVWSMLRTGVLERFRRRGAGRALTESMLEHVRANAPASGEAEVAGAAWLPNEPAVALAATLGFTHERYFWLMERPRGAVPAPEWPEGIRTCTFADEPALLRDWTDVYNDSFSEHYRHVVASTEDGARIARSAHFRNDGLLLAYRGGTPVGFCRCERYDGRGEIATLGTAHGARGIGLGRALLRWGVAWLEANTDKPVTLMVDGENEGALALYRSEAFAVARTRQIWGRRLTKPS